MRITDFIACHWLRRWPFCPLNLNHTYEKIRLGINHRSNRHRVHGFLHATRGDIRNFDRRRNRQGVTIAFTGQKEEGCG